MSNSFEYIDIILIAMIAAFIFLRLKNILGRKTGYEGKTTSKFYPRGMEIIKDIENNEAIKNNNVDEDAKKHFLKGARLAYEKIITAFAKGDKQTLKSLLDRNMFAEFDKALEERNKKQIKSETTFIGIKSADIKEFKKENSIYKVTVNFASEIITCKRDKNNNVIEGNPDIIKTVKDVWQFSKNMWSDDPTWYLVKTLK